MPDLSGRPRDGLALVEGGEEALEDALFRGKEGEAVAMIFNAFGVALAKLALNGQRLVGDFLQAGLDFSAGHGGLGLDGGQDNRQAPPLVRRRIAPPPFAPPFAPRSRRVANVFAMGERLPRALFD